MSLIWQHRAALNTPWNPWGDPNLLARYEADYAGRDFRVYDATHLDWLYSLDKSGDTNRIAKQATPAANPTFTAANASFGGHGSIEFSSTGWLQTGTWTEALNTCTAYAVAKYTGAVFLYDSTVANQRKMLYSSAATGTMNMFDSVGAVPGVGDYRNTPVVICNVWGATSSQLYINSVTQNASNNWALNVNAMASISLGIPYTLAPQSGTHSLACLAFFKGVHDTATRVRTERWLADKYRTAMT